MGIPSVITTDQGREFRNEINRVLMDAFGIEHRLTTAYHPQANGLDERFNQTLVNTIVKFTGEKRDTWDEMLPEVVYGYNTSVQVCTYVTCTLYISIYKNVYIYTASACTFYLHVSYDSTIYIYAGVH